MTMVMARALLDPLQPGPDAMLSVCYKSGIECRADRHVFASSRRCPPAHSTGPKGRPCISTASKCAVHFLSIRRLFSVAPLPLAFSTPYNSHVSHVTFHTSYFSASLLSVLCRFPPAQMGTLSESFPRAPACASLLSFPLSALLTGRSFHFSRHPGSSRSSTPCKPSPSPSPFTIRPSASATHDQLPQPPEPASLRLRTAPQALCRWRESPQSSLRS
jgi:hypothetical protein